MSYKIERRCTLNGWRRHPTDEAFLALMQLVQLRDCYRQGWKPNWKGKAVKQNIICFEGVLGTDWSINVQYVLSFQSKEIRNEFLENFKDLIEQAKELI